MKFVLCFISCLTLGLAEGLLVFARWYSTVSREDKSVDRFRPCSRILSEGWCVQQLRCLLLGQIFSAFHRYRLSSGRWAEDFPNDSQSFLVAWTSLVLLLLCCFSFDPVSMSLSVLPAHVFYYDEIATQLRRSCDHSVTRNCEKIRRNYA